MAFVALVASTLPVFAGSDAVLPFSRVNAGGQVYDPGKPSAKVPASSVSGLANSATSDATNATGITRGVLPSTRLPASTPKTRGGARDAIAEANQIQTGSSGGAPQLTVLGLIQATAGTVARSSASLFSEQKTVRDYGASCGGTLDDAVSVTTMIANDGHLVVPQNCTLRIATATTLSGPVTIAAGGSLKPDGVALTMSGSVTAGPYQIFSPVNGGSVVFTMAQDRFVEWWGAAGALADNTSPFNAAIAAGPGTLRLIAPTYSYVGPLVDTTPQVHVIGVGDQATVLLQNSATADGFDFGTPILTQAPTLPPASVQLYSSLEHVLLIRNVTPTAPLGSAPYNTAAKGVSMQAAGWVTLNDVHTYGSRIGIYRRHTNNTFTNRVISEIDYSIIGGDGFNFYVDSQDADYTSKGKLLQNANASTTDTDDAAVCDNSQAGATRQSSSFYWRGNFSDYFGQKLQSGGCNGAYVDGSGADVNNGGSLTGANAGTGNAFTNDFNISDLIIDGFRDFGLRVANVPANLPKVGFDGGYLLGGYTSVATSIDIESNGVSLTGSWTIDGWLNTNSGSICLYVLNARETVVGKGVALLGCTNPVYLSNAAGFDIEPTIQNKDKRASANPAVTLVNSGFGRLAPAIDAFNANGLVSGAYAAAVRITGGASSPANSIDLTRALPYAFVGGLTNLQCDDHSTGTPNATYTSASTGAPFFGQRLCTGKNLITGAQP